LDRGFCEPSIRSTFVFNRFASGTNVITSTDAARGPLVTGFFPFDAIGDKPRQPRNPKHSLYSLSVVYITNPGRDASNF
jgi:hypothetical protein